MRIIFALLAFSLFSSVSYSQYNESYRSVYHFAPKKGGIGDPCGLIYNKGKFNLFWWGRAYTEDFTTYNETASRAVVGDDNSFMYYTGSCVVDKNNTASFGKDKVIAVYTMANKKNKIQSQGLSVEGDDGLMHYYEGNPVLDINYEDFRDPTVFWYEPEQKWVMVIALPIERKIRFYSSADLKQWDWMSDFGQLGSCENIWECPDIYELPLDGDSSNRKWVLMTSVGPNKGQYFIGTFNGKSFELDEDCREFLLEGKGLKGDVFADFDANDYGDWKYKGEAFWMSPRRNNTSAHLGSGMASSYGGGDRMKGTLLSPEFVISSTAINFLIAGGNHPGKTCIDLLVNDSVVRTATGGNSSYLKWNGWNVSDYIGSKARIRINDDYDGEDFGFISVDHIMFSDELMTNNMEHALWVDEGSDFYAARAFKDYDGTLDETVWMGWMNNWDYARGEIPASRGFGFWSIPRTISLKTYPDGVRMVQKPFDKLKKLRTNKKEYSGVVRKGSMAIPSFVPEQNVYEMDVTFTLTEPDVIGLNLCTGDGRSLPVRYDSRVSLLTVDRTSCTSEDIPRFSRKMNGHIPLADGKLRLHIFVDKSSVEIFAGDGRLVFSLLTFPGENQTGVELYSENGNTAKVSLKAWNIKSVWNKQ